MNSGHNKYRLPRKTPAHRNAVIKSQLLSLLVAGKIKTTPAKARIISAEIDKVINLAKSETQASKNQLSLLLPTERAVERLRKLLPNWSSRNSGYTATLKTLPRKGDNADQVFVVLLDMKKPEKKSAIQQTLEKQKTRKSTKKAK